MGQHDPAATTPLPARSEPEKLSRREVATILAALRYWQGDTDEDERDGYDHFEDDITPLDDDEIDALCETINCRVCVIA
jgi:hypothetical protein